IQIFWDMLTTIKVMKVLICKGSGYLNRPIWTEVIKYNRIPVFNLSNWFPIFICNYRRDNKLIIDSVLIGIIYYFKWIHVAWSFSVDHRIICFFHTIPAFISIHGIITS